MKISRLGAMAAMLMSALIAASPIQSSQAHLSPASSSALRQATIPVLVPGTVPFFGPIYLTPHVGLPWTAPGGYVVALVPVPGCDGSACTFASVVGAPGRITRMIPGNAKEVTLHDGSHGFYIETPCTANCEDSSLLTFTRGSAHYEIIVKAGTLEEALAIERGLKPLSR
jgi:hypothetical protein